MLQPQFTQYPNAWYQLILREQQSESVLFIKGDFQLNFYFLYKAAELFSHRKGTYYRMSKGYHLQVRTPDVRTF